MAFQNNCNRYVPNWFQTFLILLQFLKYSATEQIKLFLLKFDQFCTLITIRYQQQIEFDK